MILERAGTELENAKETIYFAALKLYRGFSISRCRAICRTFRNPLAPQLDCSVSLLRFPVSLSVHYVSFSLLILLLSVYDYSSFPTICESIICDRDD